MKTSTTAAILLAAPMIAEAFMPSAGLTAAPSLRGGQQRASAASGISRIGMQAKDSSEGQGVSRRDTLGLLSLAPFVAAGLATGKAAPAEAKFLPIEDLMTKAFSSAVPSVCFISTEYTSMAAAGGMDPSNLPKGVGSGFVWDKAGHIVTNFHVINKVDNAMVTFTDENGVQKQYKAKLTGVDPDKDIAVLKIDAPASELTPLPIGDSSGIKVGQIALAIGNPFGQDHTLTTGVVSGRNRQITAPTGRKINGVIQTDAAINPGNSGGPLLDSEGKIIGINTASLGSAQGVSAGVGFAIPIATASGVVDQLVKFGQVQRAVLGISYLERLPSPAEAAKSGIPRIEKGVVVLEVPAGSPCAVAGMQGAKRVGGENGNPGKTNVGDVIVGIDKFPINKPTDLGDALGNFKPGDKVHIAVLRGSDLTPTTLDVKLGAFKGSAFSKIELERPPVDSGDGINAMNVPLKDIAPMIDPKLPPA